MSDERLIENPDFEFLHDDGDGGSWMQEVDPAKPIDEDIFPGLAVFILNEDGSIFE